MTLELKQSNFDLSVMAGNRAKNQKIMVNFKDYEKLSYIGSMTYIKNTALVGTNSIIHPHNSMRRLWSVVVSLIILYNAYLVPLRLALVTNPFVLVIDYLLDCLMIGDMYLSANVFGYYANGQLYTDKGDVNQVPSLPLFALLS